ncbi:uncharacterized protein LOC108956550 isoform X2 [Eucalyptus grandis]|uniref:uncharacterized protein LOC108956550 isoform X2 n=1 Tax=Eucalyptus grandis TaxID=71139 RepID=UPI00192F0BEF|nr:uncharacterized protein LOC108956550 isoform X2 [Eucalyptus grandis]
MAQSGPARPVSSLSSSSLSLSRLFFLSRNLLCKILRLQCTSLLSRSSLPTGFLLGFSGSTLRHWLSLSVRICHRTLWLLPDLFRLWRPTKGRGTCFPFSFSSTNLWLLRFGSGEDGGVESGEGFAGDGHGGLEGGASSLQLAEAVDNLSQWLYPRIFVI